MKLLTTGPDLKTCFQQSLDKYDEVRLAVAWATLGIEPERALFKASTKLKQAIVGTHFFQTDPRFLREWAKNPSVRFHFESAGVFHPKVYLFETSASEWAAIIGSSNFTGGGFGLKNQEASVFLSSDEGASPELYNQFRSLLNFYWSLTHELVDGEVEYYERMHAARAEDLARLRGERTSKGGSSPQNRPPIASLLLGWDEYVDAVRIDRPLKFDDRMFVLNTYREYFTSVEHFSELHIDHQRRIAGVDEDTTEGQWQLFGANSGNVNFDQQFHLKAAGISFALDEIPMEGQVTRAHFDSYVQAFYRVMPSGASVGIMSRFLAMKRPDQFLCINGPNAKRLGALLGQPYSTLQTKILRYWELFVEPIRKTEWWKTPRPIGDDTSDIWRNRAAMLDCICYDHTARKLSAGKGKSERNVADH